MNLSRAALRFAVRIAVAGAVSAASAASAQVPPDGDAAAVRRHLLQRGDHDGRPFVMIDKRRARLWVFDARGAWVADSPVLLGQALGDDSAPGIGDKPLAQVKPAEKTTPAGRFVGEHGLNANGEDVIWVDYDAAVSMHRVRATVAAERRLQRLASPTPADNRISFGCVNVPARFFDRHLMPLVVGRPPAQRPVIYVLPETRPALSLFAPVVPTPAVR